VNDGLCRARLGGKSRHIAAIGVMLLGTACGADGPSGPPSCDTAVLTVTRAAGPSFSWEPSHCGIYLLTVEHDSSRTPVVDWLVEGNGNSILPPVAYGTRPATALPFCGLFCPIVPAATLKPGQRYTVVLAREIPHSQGGPIMEGFGSTTFVP